MVGEIDILRRVTLGTRMALKSNIRQSRSQPRSQDLSSYRLLEQALGKRLAAVLEVIVLGKVLILMFAWSVQITSGLDTKVSSRCIRFFRPPCWCPGGTPTWRLHTGLSKFVQNISTNIWNLGRLTDLKLGEESYLFISYSIIISHWMVFGLLFGLRDIATQLQ